MCAETSGLWTTSGTPSGHQVASYTQALASIMWDIASACSGFEGVAPSYLNELECTDGGANTVDVDTGGAIVDGKWYKNDAVENVNIPSAVGGGNTRIDRIVIRATWANFEAVITRIAGTDAASPVAPSITQTSGTTYDIQLCQVLVDTSGNVTVTDERTWAMVAADETTIENNTGTLRVKDSGITAGKIANRTRTFLAPCIGANDAVSGDRVRTTVVGYNLGNTTEASGFANFIVPQDFASGLTVRPIIYSTTGSGDIYYKTDVQYGAVGEAFNNHAHLGSYAALTMSPDDWQLGASVSVSSAAADDIVSMRFYRDGAHASDTYSGFMYILGYWVSYTADS